MMEGLCRAGRAVRPVLDFVYRGCGAIAAVFTCLILIIIVLQMGARWTGQQFPGSTDYAGYCMAAASYFAMAYALNHGSHIRVSLLLTHLSGLARRIADLWCFGLGAGLSGYFAFYAIKGVRVSHMLNDVSQGQDATPLWIPQLSLAIGTVVLTVALLDHFVRVLFTGTTEFHDEAH